MNTLYERKRQIALEVATVKANQKPSGVSSWPFEYRKEQVIVTARKHGRTSTTPVKNKGK